MDISSGDSLRGLVRNEHLALTTLGNDAKVHIASFLGAKGVACLGQTCRHFGQGCVGIDGQMTSRVEELARQIVYGSATDYEKSVLVGGGEVKMLHELELMRSPLYFEQLIGDAYAIRYSQPGDKSGISLGGDFARDPHATAINNHEMRTGRHYVTFNVTGVRGDIYPVDFGVIRPVRNLDKKILHDFDPLNKKDSIFDPSCYEKNHEYRKLLLADKTDEWGDNLHICSYNSREGKCFFSNWNDNDDWDDGDNWKGDDWEGMEPAPVVDNLAVGLLLDLNAGTLSVFKDGRKLGVMKEGLTGSYCWFVFQYEGPFKCECSIDIKRGMPP